MFRWCSMFWWYPIINLIANYYWLKFVICIISFESNHRHSIWTDELNLGICIILLFVLFLSRRIIAIQSEPTNSTLKLLHFWQQITTMKIVITFGTRLYVTECFYATLCLDDTPCFDDTLSLIYLIANDAITYIAACALNLYHCQSIIDLIANDAITYVTACALNL